MTIPDWLLERARHGELTPDQQARLDADPTASARLAALDRDDAAFKAAHPASREVPELERRLHLVRTREVVARRNRATFAVLIAAAAAIAVAVVSSDELLRSPEQIEQDRPKGDARLIVYQKVGGVAVALDGDDAVHPGDVLQLSYVGAGRHGVIVSIDGRGSVTHHHSWSQRPVPAGDGSSGTVSVPHAYKLDDAPAYERFFLVTASDPVDRAAVIAAAEGLARAGEARTGSLELPTAWTQESVVVRKEPR